MSEYEIRIAPAAGRGIKKLDRPAQRKMIDLLDRLAFTPRPHGVEKLSQDPRFWRVRMGKYRVVYHIDDDKQVILVCVVGHRKDVYGEIDKLDPRTVSKELGPFFNSLTART